MTDKKYQFTAKKINQQGEDGYQVEQYCDGNLVCSQFVLAEIFEIFCKAAGIDPEIIDLAKEIDREK